MHIIAPFADAGATSTHFLAEGEKGGVLASLFYLPDAGLAHDHAVCCAP